MSTNAIDSDLYLSNAPERQSKGSNLGKDDFLKILMVQLQNQDPLKPLEDKDFIAQMATFSSLEQMTNLNNSVTNYLSGQNAISSYAEWIGKEVSWETAQNNGETAVETGVVESVKKANNEFTLVLKGGKEIKAASVVAITNQN